MENENNYKSEIIFSTFEMSKRQKVLCEDIADAVSINAQMQMEENIVLQDVKGFYVIHVENPMSNENKVYNQTVICANNTRYYSGSASLKKSMEELFEKLGDELFSEETVLKIIKQKSRNYSGKDFYKAVLVA